MRGLRTMTEASEQVGCHSRGTTHEQVHSPCRYRDRRLRRLGLGRRTRRRHGVGRSTTARLSRGHLHRPVRSARQFEFGSGGAGSRVAVQELPTVHIDVKDHPNYGQITPEYRGDVKDHPSYGQITPEYRGDVKDHPNYGQVTTPEGSVGRSSGRLNSSRSERRAREGGDDGEQGQSRTRRRCVGGAARRRPRRHAWRLRPADCSMPADRRTPGAPERLADVDDIVQEVCVRLFEARRHNP